MLAKPEARQVFSRDALTFQAPFLIEKLLKECIVQSPEEGTFLFREVLRYLVLDRNYRTKRLEMCSRRIDEVWHQFVLFTNEYRTFCEHYFGDFVHHFPGNAPKTEPFEIGKEEPPTDFNLTFNTFRAHYEELYQEELPDVWYDQRSISPDRRIIRNRDVGTLRISGSDEQLTLECSRGEVLKVNGIAGPALAFIARVSSFYVRELPGALTDEEKVGLVETLLRRRLLQIAS